MKEIDTDLLKKLSEAHIEILSNIIIAIETHNKLAISYTKDLLYSDVREILPHNIYWNKGKVYFDGFQIAGCSKSSKINSFKQFDTALIKSCCILNDKFNIQQGYNAESKRYNNSIIGIV